MLYPLSYEGARWRGRELLRRRRQCSGWVDRGAGEWFALGPAPAPLRGVPSAPLRYGVRAAVRKDWTVGGTRIVPRVRGLIM